MPTLLRLPLTIAELAVRGAVSLARAGVEHVLRDEQDRPQSSRETAQPSRDEAAVRSARTDAPDRATARRRPPAGNGASRRATASAVPQAPPPSAPPAAREGHVDREAVEVASVGPAGEPHATIDVAPPWDDYDSLPASEVIARVRGGDAAVKAAVALYEASNKGRSTVLAATRG